MDKIIDEQIEYMLLRSKFFLDTKNTTETLVNKIEKTKSKLDAAKVDYGIAVNKCKEVSEEQSRLCNLRAQLETISNKKSEFGKLRAALKWLESRYEGCSEMKLSQLMEFIEKTQTEINAELELSKSRMRELGNYDSQRIRLETRIDELGGELATLEDNLAVISDSKIKASELIGEITALMKIKEHLKTTIITTLVKTDIIERVLSI
jgi:chromosome segregation ATPase